MDERRHLAAMLRDARARTLALVEDLNDAQLVVPYLPIVNPFLWELGHIAWFQEKWCSRHLAGERAIRGDADSLYDSTAIPHRTRWSLPLPTRAGTLTYAQRVLEIVLERLETRELTDEARYFHLLSLFHEDMHDEALTYTRQTLGLPEPGFAEPAPALGGPLAGDVEFGGGRFELGAPRELPFVFDNEKWAHEVEVRPFALARAATTQGEIAAFVDDGGYRRSQLWSPEGWAWREKADANAPLYWRREGPHWQRRHYDQWVALEPHRAMLHVNWFEADAYCRWARRRLPLEVEWEFAAAGSGPIKRAHPWGAGALERLWAALDSESRAALDGESLAARDVGALQLGDTPEGVRQMFGNVWEWCADWFMPYREFAPDPYAEYSAPWFGAHKVLRGGCVATRARLLRTTWRNFYTPDRRDVFAGLRTAAP